ncbi:MAG: ABC transporter permease [Anaerolineales bacterium]|nr:ABC transporter permease [Anaerolineales bacterium]
MNIIEIPKQFPFQRKLSRSQHAATIVLSLSSAILLWHFATQLWKFPPFILPSPALVWQRFLQALLDGSLLRHSAYTLFEVLCGLTLGVVTATLLGYLLAKSHWFERLLSPYIVASQSIPIVAIAPLLVIWFGPGIFSKILICALIVFFPVLVNTIVGLRSVPEELSDLMRSLKADRWQTIRFLEAPAALPVFLGGLRIGATLSVIGAVVGEFVGADRGLGFLVNVARGKYDTPLVFVAVFTLIAMALLLYTSVFLIEKRLLTWQKRQEETLSIL